MQTILVWRRCRVAVLLSLGLVPLCAGCGDSAPLPSDSVARASLEAALNTWRDGGKPGTLAGSNPPIQVFDTPWSRGQKLSSYEILREEPSSTEKRFAVRLSFGDPKREQEAQYYVFGRGPVWVYRDEDYVRNMNMENGPGDAKSTKVARRR
jgi:hypothetical protein